MTYKEYKVVECSKEEYEAYQEALNEWDNASGDPAPKAPDLSTVVHPWTQDYPLAYSFSQEEPNEGNMRLMLVRNVEVSTPVVVEPTVGINFTELAEQVFEVLEKNGLNVEGYKSTFGSNPLMVKLVWEMMPLFGEAIASSVLRKAQGLYGEDYVSLPAHSRERMDSVHDFISKVRSEALVPGWSEQAGAHPTENP